MYGLERFPRVRIIVGFVIVLLTFQCKDIKKPSLITSETNSDKVNIIQEIPKDIETPEGMVWIPGGVFQQGAVPHDNMALAHEKPAHKVAIDGFFMDITEVTNAKFAKFVGETAYVTMAERKVDWEEMKKQLPEETPKPHDSIMQPGSLTFKKTKTTVSNLYDFSQWWKWTIGANWKHTNGSNSAIEGMENYPVVHIAFEDAQAYCKWAEKRLPTEAEWEYAARGNKKNTIYFWGDDISQLPKNANTWEGEFPVTNKKMDGFEHRAPVKSYEPNEFGLYDMAGNVWEWTSDWYNTNYYGELTASNKISANAKGAKVTYNPNDLYAKEKVIKGGSFLCNASYCGSYRISSRMGTNIDSSLEHLGFRTVATFEMTHKK